MEYGRRNIIKQGNYYPKHVLAMTAEALHAKSAIAAELAHRDIEIDKLKSLIVRATKRLSQPIKQIRQDGFRELMGDLRSATAKLTRSEDREDERSNGNT